VKNGTLNIKWWTLIAPLADERRMWVYSKEKIRKEIGKKGRK